MARRSLVRRRLLVTSLSRRILGEGGSKLRWGPDWNDRRADPRSQKLIIDAQAAGKEQTSK